MPAPKQKYYKVKDIMAILSCSPTKANEIMHMFAYKGQLLRDKRLLRVKITDFEAWEQEKTQPPMSRITRKVS